MAYLQSKFTAHKIKISLLFALISCQTQAQNWLPEFRAPIDSRQILTRISTLNEYLEYGLPFVADQCQFRSSTFYFRVNQAGMVDSLYSEGNFQPGEISVVTRNILGTSGNWKLPEHTKKGDHCWFTYHCYIIGVARDACRKNADTLFAARKLQYASAFKFDQRGRYNLPPNTHFYHSKK